MLLDDVTGVLKNAVQYAGIFTAPGAPTQALTAFADDLFPAATPPAAAAAADDTRWIQDVRHPWVVVKWPVGLFVPSGWIALPGGPAGAAVLGLRPGSPGAVNFVPESSPAFGLVRLSAELAATRGEARRQRDAQREARKDAARERRMGRYTPGIESPFPPRASRRPRPSRPRRPSRPARTPRAPRVPGTKNVNPRLPKCQHRNSLGQCSDKKCIASGTIPKPNEGHSSCNWGPVDSCGNCVQAGCDGPAAFLLKPFLALLPKYWTVESVTLAQQERQALKQTKYGGLQFGRLPARSPGASIPGPGTPRVDPRALAAGCACQDWPGWIICPNCSGGPKCTCRGACIAFPASTGACAAS
jgi:hypothetical protein